MIEVYRTDAAQVRGDRVAADAVPAEAVWIDLINPSKAEEQAVERLCANWRSDVSLADARGARSHP